MILVGLTALSVDTKTNLETSYFCDNLATFNVPKMFVFIASEKLTFCSMIGTCLYAAA